VTRGPATGLPAATSLRAGLPEVFVASEVTASLLDVFDEAYAPVVATLDHLAGYVDPRFAPDDFARWVASWLSPVTAERRDAGHLRRHLPDLWTALLERGTVRGVTAGVRACTGVDPEVRDNGGVTWSRRPGGSLPGSSLPLLEVDVRIAEDEADPEALLDLVRLVVEDLKPAHVPVRVRPVRTSGSRE
jgi:phage tail-like protein